MLDPYYCCDCFFVCLFVFKFMTRPAVLGAADSASSSSSSSSSFVNGATSKNLPAVQTVAPMPEDTMENMRSALATSQSSLLLQTSSLFLCPPSGFCFLLCGFLGFFGFFFPSFPTFMTVPLTFHGSHTYLPPCSFTSYDSGLNMFDRQIRH